MILAKLLPMSAVQMLGLGIGLGGGVLFYHVPVNGSLLLFFVLSVVHFFAAMSIGVLLSTFAKNMIQALVALFLLVFPLNYLSGNLVPVKNMPAAIQVFTYLDPMFYYTKIVIGIFVKGVGLNVLWPPAAALAIYAVLLLAWSTLRFKKGLA